MARRASTSTLLRLDPLPAAVVGALLIAVSSWWVAALPVCRHNDLHGWSWTMYYAGFVLVCGSWLLLGLRVRAGTVDAAPVRRFALAVAAPLLTAAPFGRDLWAYAAQGQVTGRGLDPYSVGPSAVPGAFADEVSRRWIDTPSPYGPVWLRLSQFVQWATGSPTATAVLLRLPAYLGLALCCWAVLRLAHRFGAPAALALWLGPACPLMLLLGVGGGHNDLLAFGLALAGVAVAAGTGPRALVAGAGLAALAVLIKSPALIPLAFTVPVWLVANREQLGGELRRPLLRACGLAAGSGAVVLGVGTVVCGLGTGWTRQVGADAPWTSTLSVPTALGMLGRLLTGQSPVREVDGLIHVTRTVGEVVAVLAVVALWVLAVRRTSRGGAPLGVLALALAAAVLLAPAVQPWYYLWAIVPAALVVRRHASFVGLTTVGLLFPIMIMPSGTGWESDWRFPVVVVGSLLAVLLTNGWSAPRVEHTVQVGGVDDAELAGQITGERGVARQGDRVAVVDVEEVRSP